MAHSAAGNREIKLEVCVDSIASAMAAVDGGASRIELCSALSEGGLTPSVGTLKVLKELPLNIDIFCMLRPRRGNDFVYSEAELDAILYDMEILRKTGADGFVFGALTEDRSIDVKSCRRIIQNASDLPLTFHRAFDLTNPQAMHENVAILREIGFKRILSSGFRQTASEGSEFLAQLIARHHRENDIKIMPGAGITADNLEELLTITKCKEFHASATKKMETMTNSSSKMDCDNVVTMGRTVQDIESYSITDVNIVRKMVSIARAMTGTI